MSMEILVWLYFGITNLLGFALMGIDKRKAINHQWRIRERSFFLVSLLGGSLGTWAGMYCFRHKTKHGTFVIGIPLILIIQVAVMAARVIYG